MGCRVGRMGCREERWAAGEEGWVVGRKDGLQWRKDWLQGGNICGRGGWMGWNREDGLEREDGNFEEKIRDFNPRSTQGFSEKIVSPFGPADWPALGKIYTNVLFY